ncbi:Na+/H+ antiporter subunit E [uncultured Rhodoblastus sp.]|uniref:Na+/H+ antiporter subunit E n=1 Tax=uncultured Rhodoblastus sp. TaxID=543037 RepID=UPI0025CF8C09|nr:Na+/H+ antiporter subunit E [uncultured Rhodoblastus sp.]
MSGIESGQTPNRARAAGFRAALFFAFWLAISGWKAADLPVGLMAAAAATWASLALMPPTGAQVRPRALAALALHFLRGSVVAGFDVARRALGRKLDLNPGFVTAPLRLPPGAARDAFCALASLAPGSLPVEIDGDTVLIHCLDIKQPVAKNLAAQETLFMRTFHDE